MRTKAYEQLRKKGTVRYQCPYCHRVSAPGGKTNMDRHVRGQQVTGRTRRYLGCATRLAMEAKKRAAEKRIPRLKEAVKAILMAG